MTALPVAYLAEHRHAKAGTSANTMVTRPVTLASATP